MSWKQKVLKVKKKIFLCKHSLLNCLQRCGKIFCQKMAGFHDKVTFPLPVGFTVTFAKNQVNVTYGNPFGIMFSLKGGFFA
ncbi:MAG: hypothetical protein KAT34_21565 [Candidatus Aminicenantes bacterium]|nr:hypothetical protein [Candidatus Aminicenantes bacterium]